MPNSEEFRKIFYPAAFGARRESGPKAFQNNLTPGLAALDQGMSPPQVAGVNGSEVAGQGRPELTLIDQKGSPFQDQVLDLKVGGREQAAGKHEFPMDGDGLLLEGHDVQLARVVNDGEATLRRDDGDNGR